MNKKGFAFVESIIVLTVVTLSLSQLLLSYSLISRKTREKENYDKASDKYLLNAVLTLGTNASKNYESLLEYGDTKITPENCASNTKLQEIYCGSDESCKNDVCKSIYENLNIVSLYLVADVDLALREGNPTNMYDNGTIDYMKTLKKCNDGIENLRYVEKIDGKTDDSKSYFEVLPPSTLSERGRCLRPVNYIIGVFYRNNKYFFASVPLTTSKSSKISTDTKSD